MPKTIANATVDRLLHHAYVVLTAGDSIRLTQATAGKGVTPLTKPFIWRKTADEILDNLASYIQRIPQTGH